MVITYRSWRLASLYQAAFLLLMLCHWNVAADPRISDEVSSPAKAAAETQLRDPSGLRLDLDVQFRGPADSAAARQVILTYLQPQLEQATEPEREEILQAIEMLGQSEPASDSGDSMIAILAILLSLGMPVLIVAIVMYAGYRRRRLLHDTIHRYVEGGREMPDDVLMLLKTQNRAPNHLQGGLMLLGIGLGLIVFFAVIDVEEGIGIGAIPLFIGMAKLLIWKLEAKNRQGDPA